MKTEKPGTAFWGLPVMLAIAIVGVVNPASAAPLDTTGVGPGANAIVVHAQDVNTGQVIVESVTTAQDGWLLIRLDKNSAPGDVIGFASVHRGTNSNARVDIQLTDSHGNDDITPMLWATLVPDPDALIPFASPGPTITQLASAAMVAFGSTAASQMSTSGGKSSSGAANANKIAVRAQGTDTGQVIVDSLTAAQNGWLLIRKDKNGAPGDMIGFAPVHRGVNTSVRVDIQLADFFGDDNITPTLWATLMPDPNALTPFAVPDSTILQEASAATAAFSSTAAGATAPAVVTTTSRVATTSRISSSSSAASANRITVRAQDTSSGQVVVDSATCGQVGWLLIRNDANGAPGNVLGFAPVHQGLNANITVDIKIVGRNGNDDVTPTLWATLVPDPNALNPFAMPDITVQQEGSLAMVPFSTR